MVSISRWDVRISTCIVKMLCLASFLMPSQLVFVDIVSSPQRSSPLLPTVGFRSRGPPWYSGPSSYSGRSVTRILVRGAFFETDQVHSVARNEFLTVSEEKNKTKQQQQFNLDSSKQDFPRLSRMRQVRDVMVLMSLFMIFSSTWNLSEPDLVRSFNCHVD